MKRLVGLLFVLAVFSVAWTDAHAKVLFNSTLVCNTDGNNVFGERSDAAGHVQITSRGVFKAVISGLPPGVQANCQLICNFSSDTPVLDVACGTAKASGKLSFTSPRSTIDPTVLCTIPVAGVLLSDGGVCVTGWGTGTRPGP